MPKAEKRRAKRGALQTKQMEWNNNVGLVVFSSSSSRLAREANQKHHILVVTNSFTCCSLRSLGGHTHIGSAVKSANTFIRILERKFSNPPPTPPLTTNLRSPLRAFKSKKSPTSASTKPNSTRQPRFNKSAYVKLFAPPPWGGLWGGGGGGGGGGGMWVSLVLFRQAKYIFSVFLPAPAPAPLRSAPLANSPQNSTKRRQRA